MLAAHTEASHSHRVDIREDPIFAFRQRPLGDHLDPCRLRPTDTYYHIFRTLHREIVLGRVADLVKKFVRKVAYNRGLSESAANSAGGKIFTFGSYRLGVHGPGSDIDTLCVVPKHVSREDFFDVFEPMLRELEGVTEVSVRGLSLLVLARKLINVTTGCSRGLCADYQDENFWDSYRFVNGPISIVINTG